MMSARRRAALTLSLFALALPARAQWSSDATFNLSVGDGASDQILPKVAPTADGGCYVSWFDGIANGYDVRLQRLDVNGVEQWSHNGVLVADRSFSSVQDYGLDVHASGDALLTFRDDHTGSVQISAQRVTAAGALAWGPSGVQLTSTTGFVASPKVAGTTAGGVVVAWTQDGVTRVMRLAADGIVAWPADVVLAPAVGNYSVSDLHDSGDEVILSMVHQTTSSFLSPKHLVAQKLDAAGASQWGAQPVAVFDGGSLQIGNFPTFVPDGNGGAVFAWYGTSPLQCYAQRIRFDGLELFPHNGAPGSTDLANVRVSPAVAFEPATSSTFLFWKEQDGSQSLSGLYGQKFDLTGAPLWGATGKELVPVGATQVNWVRTLTTGAGAYVLWIASPSFGQDTGHGAVVDANGDFVVSPLAFASTPSGKTRLAAAKGQSGDALLAWGDARNDGGDILAQNLRADGTLGAGSAFSAYCFGVGCPCGNDGGSGAGCANQSGSGAQLDGSGAPSVGADTFALVATNAAPGNPGLFFQGNDALNGGAGLPFGDGLRCAGGNLIRLVTVVADTLGCAASDGSCGTVVGGTPGSISSNPNQSGAGAVAPGDTRRYQYWYRDLTGPCGTGFNLTNGLEVSWN